MFKDRFQLSRQQLEFWYSIAIIVVIPLLIAANTLWLISGLNSNFDYELRSKANLANEVAGASLINQLDNPDSAQRTIAAITKQRDDIKTLELVSTSESSNPKIIAAKDTSRVGKSAEETQISLVLGTKKAIASEVRDSAQHYWHVVTPLADSSGTVNAVLISDVSIDQADAATNQLLMRSLVVMGITIVITILLLANHFKFVEYAMLFKRLKEVDQLKNDFLSVATHELRAPMTIIKGNIENIADGLYGPVEGKVKEVLLGMSAETDRLNNLVNDLLNVSRVEQGRMTYEIKPVNIVEITSRLVDQYLAKAQSKNLELRYDAGDKPLMVSADSGRLTEIMTNLIDNAVKYSDHGTVEVSHHLADGMLQTKVKDSGIGMTAEEREKLFTRFYRAKNERTKNIGGTGLGLWIIKQYVEHMGGQIDVDSLPGVGSEFIVTLPLANSSVSEKPENSGT